MFSRFRMKNQSISRDSGVKWRPGIKFLFKRAAQFTDPIDGVKRNVAWAYTRISSPELPVFYYKCSLKVEGQPVSEGFAIGWLPIRVLKISLAEAWERYWADRYSKMSHDGLPRFRSSNGFASGEDRAAALRSAQEELIERYVFLQSWKSQSGWIKKETSGFIAGLIESILQSKGWKLSLFTIGSPGGVSVLAGYAKHDIYGVAFDTIYIGQNSQKSVFLAKEFKLVLSILKSTAFRIGITSDPIFVLPDKGTPNDHAKFYANPKNACAFESLTSTPLVDLSDFGGDSINTVSIIEASQLPAVAVAFNSSWEVLTWGKQSIGGTNPWPHPLA